MASLNPISGVLGRRKAAHLLRRTCFHYTRTRVDELAQKTASEALSDLLAPRPFKVEQPLYAKNANATPVTWINPPQPPSTVLPGAEVELRRFVMAWWVNEALHDTGIGHKLSFFFHQFLAVSSESGTSAQFFDYLTLLRWGSMGNFKLLVTKMVMDNCMLNYINNNQNFFQNPNENFAREFFELHTIGKGQPAGPGDYTHYTEEDIVQAARILTGLGNSFRHNTKDVETGIPSGRANPQSHDFGEKIFSPRFGNTAIKAPSNDATGMKGELDALVNMIFAQEETSRNLCRRLYHFFVTRRISAEVENDIIGPLAQTLRAGNFEIKPVLNQLLQSEHFFDADDANNTDEIVGALIKSPLDLSLQTLSFFSVPIPDPVAENQKHYVTFYNAGVLERMLARAGMELFFPPEVAGYPGYYQNPDFNRQFFNSATILARYKLPQMLLNGSTSWTSPTGDPLGTQLDIAKWAKDGGFFTDPADAYILVTELIEYLFPEDSTTERFMYFLDTIFLDGLPPGDWTYEWEQFVSTGNDKEVKIPLGRLINAVLYAPEQQVM